jgi:6-phosphogluconolactonase
MNTALVFIGSYAAADKPGIHAFSFDDESGVLTPCGSFSGMANPSFVIANSRAARSAENGLILYAVSETSASDGSGPGSVWALRVEREADSGKVNIRAINHQPSRGGLGCHLTLDATGRWLLVANYGTGSAGVMAVLPDGSLGEMTAHVQHVGSSGVIADRQEGPHAHSTTLSPDNRFAIIADLGLDQLIVYRFDRVHGKRNRHGQAPTRPGAGPRHAVFHPNGHILYVANELGSTVSAYAWDAASGTLRETQTLDTVPPGAPENYVADIHIASAADRLYVSNRGHDSIAVYDVDAAGSLALVAAPPCGGHWPRNFALAPGRFMLVANQHSDEVAVLPVLEGPTALGAPVGRVAAPQACCVEIAEIHNP